MIAESYEIGLERRTLKTEQSYSLHQAIKDLMQSNLLQSVLLPSGSSLMAYDPAEALENCPDDAFLGAGLDSRNLPENGLFVALAGEQVDGRNYVAGPLSTGNWVLTRPCDSDEIDPLLAHTAAPGCGVLLSPEPELALARLAACWRRTLAVEIVAITGTNGKTTTKDLVRAMLSGAGKTQATAGNLNNHLGLPLTLLNLQCDSRYAVIEMGASAVGEIKFLAGLTDPKVGIITNASPAHLAEFGSLENIIEGKGELLECLPDDGVAVLNTDSPGFGRWENRAVCPVVTWGTEQGDHIWSWRPETEKSGEQLVLDGAGWNVPLPGRLNAANLCAAILACRGLGVSDKILRAALQSFTGSDHRGSIVRWAGRKVLDDSYNANPASMLAAVQTLLAMPAEGQTVAVLGAMAELGDDSECIHGNTGNELGREKLDFLLAVGETAFPLVGNDQVNFKGVKVPDHIAAADWLRKNTSAGDRILIKGSRSSAMEKVLQLLLADDEQLDKGTKE